MSIAPSNIGGQIVPLADWRKVWGPAATADNGGTLICDPYDVTSWTLPSGTVALASAFKNILDGGRLFECNEQAGDVWLWVLSSTLATTCRLRAWMLGFAPSGPVEYGPLTRRSYLGPAVRLYDAGSGLDYFDFTAPAADGVEARVKLLFETNAIPYRDASGVTYYGCGAPIRLDGARLPFLLVTMDAVSAGNFIVLAKA